MAAGSSVAVFGGGCFWCTEAIFKSLKGVVSVTPGYTGGTTTNPTYGSVCGGRTGHVEAVKIEFDPSIISYADLLNVFFHTHDPTTPNRQGNDIGTEYNSAVFFADRDQEQAARQLIKELSDSHAYDNPIVTQVRPADVFYPAEDYHQRFYETHKDAPYCELVIAPKLEKLQKRFNELLK